MTLGYEQAAAWLEEAQTSDLRAQDVIQIIRLYMDAEKFFGAQESSAEPEWTEEDEADVEWIVKEVDALTDLERLEEGEGPEEGSGEDKSEESEDDSESVDGNKG